MERADLSTLDGAGITSLVLRDGRLAAGLAAIAPGLPLTRLCVEKLPDRRNLRGVGRWPTLERVECGGIPTAREIAQLGELPNLRELLLRIPQSQSAELAAVRSQRHAVRVTRA